MARSLNTDGCEYGRRYVLEFGNFKEIVTKRFDSVENTLIEIKNQNVELYNHQSSRWPKGAVWAIGIITAIASAALTTFVTKLITGGV